MLPLSPALKLCFSHAIHGHQYKDWLPTIGIVNPSAGKQLAPKTVHQLASCLRVAFCESVCVEFGHKTDDTHSRSSDVRGMVFDDLVSPSTVVGTLDICLPPSEMELALRKFRDKLVSGCLRN